jgi:hypothetical protein
MRFTESGGKLVFTLIATGLGFAGLAQEMLPWSADPKRAEWPADLSPKRPGIHYDESMPTKSALCRCRPG